jgi:hypothetical protein
MILITGCGRSGTGYITKCFAQLGLDIGHERWGRDGISSFYLAGKGRLPLWHFKGRLPTFKFSYKFHQTRHPLKAIASATTFRQPRTMSFIKENIYIPDGAEPLEFAAYYWVRWNKLVERFIGDGLRYQVENPPWEEICKILKIPFKFPYGIEKNVNTRPHEDISWKDLERFAIYEEVRKLGEKYGYN